MEAHGWDKRRHELEQLAHRYAEAESERCRLTEFRKSKKAILMKEAEKEGYKTVAAQEREAYAHPEYIELITGLAGATEIAELAKWKLNIAKMGLSYWQTKESSRRAEMTMR